MLYPLRQSLRVSVDLGSPTVSVLGLSGIKHVNTMLIFAPTPQPSVLNVSYLDNKHYVRDVTVRRLTVDGKVIAGNRLQNGLRL